MATPQNTVWENLRPDGINSHQDIVLTACAISARGRKRDHAGQDVGPVSRLEQCRTLFWAPSLSGFEASTMETALVIAISVERKKLERPDLERDLAKLKAQPKDSKACL